MEDNPMCIQYSPYENSRHATPLVLIHDGGGTIFPYLRLGSLNRDVWAIHDPNWSTSELYEGGLDEMAGIYIDFIKNVGIRGSILLGGWSLGGYISLAIAKKLAGAVSPEFSIAGMLIIDSPLHIPMCKLRHAGPDPDFEDLPELVRKSFANCDVYLKEWELPHWDGPTCKGSPVRATIHDEVYTIPNDRVLQKRLGQKWCTIEVKSFEHDAPIPENSAGPPPAVMIRCDLPSPNGRGLEPCHIDRFRHEPLLRWYGSYPSFIKAVINVDTTHYGIFDPSHVKVATQQLNESLDILDGLKVL